MKNNNGKIAIAIVAMFVVALSVVGVTYAYFTANVTGNTLEKSATVKAGALTGTWTGIGGEDGTLTAKNVVPAWKSDTLSFYDPSYAYPNGQIVACTKGEGVCNDDYATADYGITDPISFTVTNTSDVETIYYGITLTTNELTGGNAAEVAEGVDHLEKVRKDLKATLYEGTFNATAENYGGTVVKEVVIAPKGESKVLTGPVTLAAGADAKNYFIVVEYVDNGDQDEGQAVSFQVQANIVGLGLNNNNTETTADDAWYDASGKAITEYDYTETGA